MAKKGGNPQNLKTPTTEQARIIGAMGGKKSAAVKKERKLLSQIYAGFLASEFSVVIDDLEQQFTGEKLVEETIKKVLARSDSSSVAVMKEIREATEGNKLELSGELKCIKIEIVDKASDGTV